MAGEVDSRSSFRSRNSTPSEDHDRQRGESTSKAGPCAHQPHNLNGWDRCDTWWAHSIQQGCESTSQFDRGSSMEISGVDEMRRNQARPIQRLVDASKHFCAYLASLN
jgi:hypothetical protein